MPLPEGYLPRRGDTIVVHAEVRHDVDPGETDVHVRIVDTYRDVVMKLSNAVGLFARKLEVGETVRLIRDQAHVGTVAAVCDGLAWVKLQGGGFATWATTELEVIAWDVAATPQSPPPAPAGVADETEIAF